ncbi:MAG: hypothetical protein ABI409_13705, partial [Ramlibacter sp.]
MLADTGFSCRATCARWIATGWYGSTRWTIAGCSTGPAAARDCEDDVLLPPPPQADNAATRAVDQTTERNRKSTVAPVTDAKIVATHHGDLILPGGIVNRIITTVMFSFFRFMAENAGRLIGYSDDYANHSYYL